jgi:two-component system nitrogen regulation response regulator GlnG
MASGREVHVGDLPPELTAPDEAVTCTGGDWVPLLRAWAEAELRRGNARLLDGAVPRFETTMIEVALAHTQGRRGEAAELLGWGRNTLTRKIKELGLSGLPDAGD